MEYGNFDLGDVNEIFPLQEIEKIGDIDFLNEIFEDDFTENGNINASTGTDEATKEMNHVLEKITAEENDKIKSETEEMETKKPNKKRFKTMLEEDLCALETTRRSKSTIKSTKWGVKMFQDWSQESNGHGIDFHSISAEDLNANLRKFYAEAQPKENDKRTSTMTAQQANEYHKNSFRSIRSAINRHLQDIGRDVDIVRDRDFKQANNTLDGKLKQNVREGLSRPTKHKQIILPEDLMKISTYLYPESGTLNPIILRYRVWYDLSLHFVTRGLEFHNQLNMESFLFCTDENGIEYVTLTHETKEKTKQGGLDSESQKTDKRMYASSDPQKCPVESLRLLISKTDTTAKSLFNHCSKMALSSPDSEKIWFPSTPVKQYQFTRFLPEISKNSSRKYTYTAHSLRATAIQKMNDSGFELRHIMYMSGHKNEGSIRSYNRDCSTVQKRKLSESLLALKHGSNSTVDTQVQDANTMSAINSTSVESINNPDQCRQFSAPYSVNSSNFMSSGFISNSNFNNCVFQFKN